MSIREQAQVVVDKMTDEQLEAFLFWYKAHRFEEVEPEQWEIDSINEYSANKAVRDETVSQDEMMRILGLNKDEL